MIRRTTYHAEKGYTNEPKRLLPNLPPGQAGLQRNDDGFDRGGREMHPVVCAECGKDTTVPFLPRGDRQPDHLGRFTVATASDDKLVHAGKYGQILVLQRRVVVALRKRFVMRVCCNSWRAQI